MKEQLIFLLFCCLFFANCNTNKTSQNIDLEPIAIIPQPISLEQKEGVFMVSTQTKITGEQGLGSEIPFFEGQLKKIADDKQGMTNTIHFKIKKEIEHEEGYEIYVSEKEINILAKNPKGAFYATQTLYQLNQNGYIPCIEIKDSPRFSYRGMHLDVARHFSSIETIKKYIDLLAYHKFNRFHWHLTEDQGWRIEIKQYPKLTEMGAWRKETLIGHYSDQPHQFDGKKHGGFYTQEEVKEVVQYAALRHITIIPEIEMPGHSLAALTAYPELGCTDGPFEVATKWGIFEEVFCPEEKTFEFLENVLTEVMALFPSKYIHIGGDECPKTAWKNSAFCQQLIQKEGLKDEHELQSYFIRRIEQFLNKNGRQIIGWDEILEGGLAPNATVMSWRGVSGGIEAAQQGHDVVMTPTTHCYLDYYQSTHPNEPLAIGGFLPLSKVYSYEPVPTELNAEEGKHILGVQGNVWTEYMPTAEQIFYMAYPRACAIAEIGWSAKKDKNYEDFTSRILPHLERLKTMGIQPANHLFDVQSAIKSGNGKGVFVDLIKEVEEGKIHYTVDGSEPNSESPAFDKALKIEANTTLKAKTFVNGKIMGNNVEEDFNWHKAAGKKITFTAMPHEKYSGNGIGSIINGVLGSNERYGDAEWLGFDGINAEMIIDFGQKESFQTVKMRFYKGEGQWIYLPSSVTFSTSDNGQEFTVNTTQTAIETEGKIAEIVVELDKAVGQFLKIEAVNFGTIPDGRQGAGHQPWLFLDEVIVQ